MFTLVTTLTPTKYIVKRFVFDTKVSFQMKRHFHDVQLFSKKEKEFSCLVLQVLQPGLHTERRTEKGVDLALDLVSNLIIKGGQLTCCSFLKDTSFSIPRIDLFV